MAEAAVPSKGTRPDGAGDEVEASRKVREMFTRIAPRYDFLNHFLSFELDRAWRWRTARILRPLLDRPDAVVLDLCCGTGDLSFALRRSGRACIVGADFSHTMLVRAVEKARTRSAHDGGRVGQFLEADALSLPFAPDSFDLVTTAFGFRNLANYVSGLREIRRVLKPGGTLAILEFTEPPNGLWGNFYRWYFCKLLPRIGGWISGEQTAYKYLPNSVARFFRPEELAALMGEVGYTDIRYRSWTLGTLALHTGVRAEE
jgi:demethylmenaquinone methyltransferase/2-methoxy-6-polyprenyl-1,4-benzoquinol methylase